ncbi:MAG: NADH-quinone oxidoreductase subunit A [Thermoplasmata archaeon]|nr:NADH-quinone oxidoreductase subunit A [Thermoplasmata archaeon]
MLSEAYFPVFVFAVIGLLFPAATFALNKYFRPTKLTKLKDTIYECGSIPIGEAKIQFHFQYYMFAIIFVVFDIVVVFIMLWAITYQLMDIKSSIYILAFIGILSIGLTYALKKEAKIWI